MIGTQVLHYQIVEKLGEGGMGIVYKARDTKLDRVVALKFLPQHLTSNEAEQARFLQEARAAAALNHPNVCSVFDIQEVDGQRFIVMEYLDGDTLRNNLPVAKLQDALHVAIQIGEALQSAHSKGIVHRDVKCENIMLTTDGRIKVMDFGLAKLKGSLKLTRTSSTVGTLAYMAPEQIQGGEVDARSDIFSYGVVLFELLTGRLPFRGEHEAAVMYSIVNEEPESVLKYCPGAGEDVDRIIRRALEKDPADRYQHMDDLVSELQRLKKQTTRVVRPRQDDRPVPHAAAEQTPVRTSGLRPVWAIVAVGLVLIAAAVYFFLPDRGPSIDAIAVMPFVNSRTDSTTEYLTDGFTENLINSLSKLPGIKLMSRNSVFRYKGKEIDPQEVGTKLKVGAILLGRISQSGDGLSVSVELVDTRDDSHLWGEQYNSTPGLMMSLPGKIADAVSHQLDLTLTGAQEQELSKQTTQNSEAYQSYLKGIFHLRKRTTDGLLRSREYFDQAIAADGQFALAYAGLSDCYNLMGAYFVIPSAEARTKAKAAAMKSIQLDENLAEGHTSLATALENYDWNFTDAEKHYKRALALNPNYGTAHQWYGEFLSAMGRFDEALGQSELALELDPLSPIIWFSSAGIQAFSGNLAEAHRLVDKGLELDPRFPRGRAAKAQLMYLEQNMQGAIEETQKAIEYSDSSNEYVSNLGFYYGVAGRRDDAKKILNRLLHPGDGEIVFPYMIATVYGSLGDRDRAFEWLEKEFQNRSFTLEFLRNDPFLLLLRDDPRYDQLVRRVGLPDLPPRNGASR